MTGDAADEVFGGYDRIRRALTDGPNWAAHYTEALAAVPPALRDELYSGDYLEHLRGVGTEAQRLERQLSSSGRDRLEAITELEVDERLPAYHLRRVDHLSMASSVEVRLPFCQPALVQLARSLPTGYRVEDGAGKRALYAAARGLLPESVLNRPKQPFTLPITSMLTEGHGLFDHARDVLAPSRLSAGGQLDPGAVTKLIDRQATDPSDTSALAIWSLMIHQIWVDGLGNAGGSDLEREEVA